MVKNKPQTLEYKQSILNGIVSQIEAKGGTMLPKDINEKIEALKVGLSTRIDTLVERCRHEEIDLKIASMREVLELVKNV